MIFTSFEFVVFFLMVMLVRSCLRSFSAEKTFLLVASYAFYMSWSISCGFLILLTSLLDYFVGVGLGKIREPYKRKLLLIVSIVANLGVLAFFKYTNFFVDNVWGIMNAFGLNAPRWHYDIILPAGISFFTFQSMTYTIETYRGNIPACHRPRDFLLFVAFFPQLLAGPINRAIDLLPQFTQRLRASIPQIESGLAQFALGAVKKIVISDQIAPHVDLIFAAPDKYGPLTLLIGAMGYGIQIYCDFSGYSDMAIGVARIMGFRFMENFQMPYSAVNITEFWRRWHISLSTWLRDYLYIPLGGNRLGIRRTYFNLVVTMVLGGLWHGASWNFVFWGALHGGALAIHKAWSTLNPFGNLNKQPFFQFAWRLFSRVLTLGVVLLGWIFFRSQTWSAATEYVGRIFAWPTDGMQFLSPYILAAIAAVFFVHLAVPKDRNWAHEIADRSLPVRGFAYAGLLFVLVTLSATDSAPFIYFQF
jgi:alginate O-acetyltransferase complex protein AlgI